MVTDEEFRAVMGTVPTPVSVVTTTSDGVPHGTTVSAFASLSLAPQLVLVSFDERSTLLPVVRREGRFGLNVLRFDQHAVAARFARRDVERFEGVDWAYDEGLPRLGGAVGWLACRVEQEVRGGDHTVLFGAVEAAAHADGDPLTYHRRAFGRHVAHDLG